MNIIGYISIISIMLCSVIVLIKRNIIMKKRFSIIKIKEQLKGFDEKLTLNMLNKELKQFEHNDSLKELKELVDIIINELNKEPEQLGNNITIKEFQDTLENMKKEYKKKIIKKELTKLNKSFESLIKAI